MRTEHENSGPAFGSVGGYLVGVLVAVLVVVRKMLRQENANPRKIFPSDVDDSEKESIIQVLNNYSRIFHAFYFTQKRAQKPIRPVVLRKDTQTLPLVVVKHDLVGFCVFGDSIMATVTPDSRTLCGNVHDDLQALEAHRIECDTQGKVEISYRANKFWKDDEESKGHLFFAELTDYVELNSMILDDRLSESLDWQLVKELRLIAAEYETVAATLEERLNFFRTK